MELICLGIRIFTLVNKGLNGALKWTEAKAEVDALNAQRLSK